MHRIRRLTIFFAVFADGLLPGMAVGANKRNVTSLVEATVKILTSCHGNRVTPVGLAGNAAGMISDALWSGDLAPVALIDADSRIVDNGPLIPINRYKLEVFVISASSEVSLINDLRRIKASVWWNHMAAFIIIDWSPFNSDCSNTVELLSIAWEMGILNAKLMCDHRTKGRLIYTFNPFTNRAPAPWRFNGTHKALNNHPWTLFVRDYVDDPEICHELDFEKANDLGGYPIVASVGDQVHRRRDKSEGMCFDPIASDTCSIVIPAMNGTLKLRIHRAANSLGRIDDQGKVHGILGEVALGTSDLSFNGRSLAVVRNLSISHTYWQIQMYSVTQYSGYKSQLQKICAVIDDDSRLGLYIVILITVVFFKFIVGKTVIEALMDTFRIVCNTVVPRITERLPPRIYLVSLFMFTVTMQGIFQGRLASLLTKPEPLRNVNTMKDLAELGHTIYGVPGYSIYFGDPAFRGRFIADQNGLCTRYAVRDPKAACVAQERIINIEAANHKLHRSRKVLATNFISLPIRSDWPLERRLNQLLIRSISAGLKRHLNNRATYGARRQIKLQESAYKDEGIKVMTLEQLRFAFVILGFGLSFATMTFVVEMILGHPRIMRILNRC